MRRHGGVLLAALAAALALTAGEAVAERDPGAGRRSTSPAGRDPGAGSRGARAAAAKCSAGRYQRLRSPRSATAAIVWRRSRAYRRPGRGLITMFGRRNLNGAPTVFGVLGAVVGKDCGPRWYRVQLPMKPNGRIGYVRAWSVRVRRVPTSIVVDLSQRRVVLYRNGRPVLRARAAVGTTATPTPTGRYYVNQRLIPYDTSGPFGPGAIGISAFSEVLTGWTQGGPIAIHGTNKPYLIGGAVSNGCIRVENRLLRRMFAAAAEGTPVVIRA